MKTMFRTCLGLGILTMLVGTAMAQGRGFGFGRVGFSTLLGVTSVQKELKLGDQQVEKAKELADKAREKMQEAGDIGTRVRTPQTKQRELIKEMNESTLKEAGAFLKPEQITRLKQISYQVEGINAFNDPDIAKKLNLTDSQKTAIQAVAQEMREKQPSRAVTRTTAKPRRRRRGSCTRRR